MLLEDKLLASRLRHDPEFLLRLHEVVETWGIADRPALFVQARPADGGARLDVDSPDVRNVLRAGVNGDNQWWDNLEAPHVQRSLHGVTGMLNYSCPEWLVEAHRDGHLLAGVWTFPMAPTRGDDVPVVADWYALFFRQFTEWAAKVAKAGGIEGEYLLTATLMNASGLRYATGAGQPSISGDACTLQNAQWLVYRAPMGTTAWTTLAESLARGLPGLYRSRSR